jgi:hypothetical protein
LIDAPALLDTSCVGCCSISTGGSSMQEYKKDRLYLFQEALSLQAKKEKSETKSFLTPDEMTKFSRILKLMVFLDMTKEEDPIIH